MKLFIVLTICVVGSLAIVCTENYCDSVKCAPLTQDACDGRIKIKGGICGCCDLCVKQLEENEFCLAHIIGLPAMAECREDLFCHPDKGVCQRKTCSMIRQEMEDKINAAQQAGRPLLGATLPVCLDDESFHPKQCAGSRCFCVNKLGEQIEDYSVPIWEATEMNCQCARDKHEYQQLGIVGKFFSCKANGNYRPVQCHGSACFCVDEHGQPDQTVESVHISQMDKLPCKEQRTTFMFPTTKSCAQYRKEVQDKIHQANVIGRPILGLEVPICTDDGNYFARQCVGSQCVCVMSNGVKIPRYIGNRWEAHNMNCQCARDQQEYINTGMVGKIFHCDKQGSYEPIQCTGSVCYCVNTIDGTRLLGSPQMPIHIKDQLDC